MSVVILCYRAGRKIYAFLGKAMRSLDSVTSNWEIILVGNYVPGSQDETPQIVREIAEQNPKIKCVAKPKEGWMGWDLRSGLRECTGDVIAFIDGDKQMVAKDISRGYKILMDGDYDIVMPYRQKRHDPCIRILNSKVYNVIFNMFFPGYPIKDVHAKPKIMKREAFERLNLTANDWFLDAQVMIQARRHRFRLKQFPTVFYTSVHRKSFVRLNAIWEFVINLTIARFLEFFEPKPSAPCEKLMSHKDSEAGKSKSVTDQIQLECTPKVGHPSVKGLDRIGPGC